MIGFVTENRQRIPEQLPEPRPVVGLKQRNPLARLPRPDMNGSPVVPRKQAVVVGDPEGFRKNLARDAQKGEDIVESPEVVVLYEILVPSLIEFRLMVVPGQHFRYAPATRMLHFEQQLIIKGCIAVDLFLVRQPPEFGPLDVQPFFRRSLMVETARNDAVAWITDHVYAPAGLADVRRRESTVVIEEDLELPRQKLPFAGIESPLEGVA